MTAITDYTQVIAKTTGMVRDTAVQALAQQHGLHVLDVTWEDTARFDNSAVGPNISDMTIQVQHKIAGRDEYELSCMPVIRYPNFSDLSGDISPDEFFLLVGNEKEQPLEKVTLRELLGNLRAYLTDSSSWKGDGTSLLAEERDSHVLVSANRDNTLALINATTHAIEDIQAIQSPSGVFGVWRAFRMGL